MTTKCETCKYGIIQEFDEPCAGCWSGNDLWESREIRWRHVSEPPTETTLVLISFKEPITDNLVSTGWYFPHSNRWAIVDEELAEYTPAFYIPIKELNIPENRETKH